jgi:hypothetical protein
MKDIALLTGYWLPEYFKIIDSSGGPSLTAFPEPLIITPGPLAREPTTRREEENYEKTFTFLFIDLFVCHKSRRAIYISYPAQ